MFGRDQSRERFAIAMDADTTDGIDVTAKPLGTDFPDGLLVVMNSGPRNFLLFSWRAIAATAISAESLR